MLKRFFCLGFVFIMSFAMSVAQVKIGDNPTDIHEGALLELQSQTKGMIFPRIALQDSLQVWALDGSPTQGMVIFNTNDSIAQQGLYCWYDDQWNIVGGDIPTVEQDTVMFDVPARTLYDDGDSVIISSGRVCACSSEDTLQVHLDRGFSTQGDIFFFNGKGVYIRNDNVNATTVDEAYIFIPSVVSKGSVLCAGLSKTFTKSTNINYFMVAETGLYMKPDTAMIIPVEEPDATKGTYYSFAIPNDWAAPVISLKVANSSNGFFKLDNCWKVEHNVERNGQYYQVWTMDVPLTPNVMAHPYEFKIE